MGEPIGSFAVTPHVPPRLGGFADDLDALRRRAGLSYRELSRRTGCPVSTLNDALLGRRFPRLDTVLAVVRACGGDEHRWRDRWVAAGHDEPGRAARPGTAGPAAEPMPGQPTLAPPTRRPQAPMPAVPAAPGHPLAPVEPPPHAPGPTMPAESRPEHVPRAAVPAGLPPHGPGPTVPAELPHDVRCFTGRRRELARLSALRGRDDADGVVVIIAVDGMAGVGKTALVTHWAHRVAGCYPDGQLFLDLRGHHRREPPMSAVAALDQAIRSVGGKPPGARRRRVGELARQYRTLLAGRRVLIVLDDAVSAEQVRPLLPAGPGSLVIVTSRCRLDELVALDGAHHLSLDVLSGDDSTALLTALLGRDRVARERDATGALATACGHLPLSLRIAAAHLLTGRHQRIAELVRTFDTEDRLDPGGQGGDRHAGVRRAFDLSYDSVEPAARRLFRRLGLLPGRDCTAGAAAALAGVTAPEAARLLTVLRGAHLVEQRSGRYRLHDLLRIYAAERTAAADSATERAAALRRLFGWYLAGVELAAEALYPRSLRLPTAADATATGADATDAGAMAAGVGATDTGLGTTDASVGAGASDVGASDVGASTTATGATATGVGSTDTGLGTTDASPMAAGPGALRPAGQPNGLGDQASALAWLDAERANLIAAILEAARCGPRPVAWVLADALRGYFNLRLCREWFDAATAGLDAALRDGDQRAEAAMRHSLGLAHSRLGSPASAVEHLSRALEVCDATADADRSAGILVCLGGMHRLLGQLELAAAVLEQARDLSRRHGHQVRHAAALGDLGEVYRDLGRLADALTHQQEAVRLFEQQPEPRGTAIGLLAMGTTYRQLGRLAEAYAHQTRALALFRDTGSRDGEAYALINLAATHLDGVRNHARDHGGGHSSDHGGDHSGDHSGDHGGDHGGGHGPGGVRTDVAFRLVQARRHADDGLALATEVGEEALLAEAHLTLARLHHERGRVGRAIEHAHAALRQSKSACYKHGQVDALVVLADAHRAAGRLDLAVRHGRRAAALSRACHYRLLEGAALTALAGAHHDRGDSGDAADHCRRAIEAFAGCGHPGGELCARSLLARIRHQRRPQH